MIISQTPLRVSFLGGGSDLPSYYRRHGGAVARHAKHIENAQRFLEYLASPSAQNHFANGNNEWPVAKGVAFDNPALKAMSGGSFKSELLPISAVGMNQIKVQQMLDRVGFK